MARHVRVLPLTMVAAGMLLAVKLADVVRGGQEFARVFGVSSVSAQAEDAAKAPEEKTDKKPDLAAEASKDVPKEEGKPAGEAKEAEEKPAEAAPEAGHEGAEKEGEEKKQEKPRASATAPPPEDPESGRSLAPGGRYFSPIELEILQTLSKRREQLDQWEKDIEIKENLLSGTEKHIDEKLVQIDVLKKELETMLAQYHDQEDSKIKSLVKIYESMKPRDAARIFDEVEMPILLLVIDRMAEKKAAPILAAMDAKKAKQLTVELAEQRRMQNARMAAAPPAAPKP